MNETQTEPKTLPGTNPDACPRSGRDELRGDLLSTEPNPSPGQPRRSAIQRVLVRAREPGHHGKSANRMYLRVPGSLPTICACSRRLGPLDVTPDFLVMCLSALAAVAGDAGQGIAETVSPVIDRRLVRWTDLIGSAWHWRGRADVARSCMACCAGLSGRWAEAAVPFGLAAAMV